MLPFKTDHSEGRLFSPRISKFINLKHELILLSKSIDWKGMDREFSKLFSDSSGHPPKPVRLIVGLLLLQYMHKLSDEAVVQRWIENPYWQHFCGYDYLEWEAPIHPSSLTRWRKRLGKDSLEKILSYTVRLAVATKTVKKKSLEKVIADTTVSPKNISYPTDSKLYFRALHRLVHFAKKEGIVLRQSYTQLAKKSYFKVNCYAKAKQMKRMKREQKKLKIFLGRVYRDIVRKAPKQSDFIKFLSLVKRLLEQKKTDKNKLYSLHEPKVQCIAKGKAHKRYEFGCKASFVSTHKEGLLLDAQACLDNPYDGHTLKKALKRAESFSAVQVKEAFVDKGYRGHKIDEKKIYLSGQKRGVNRRIRKNLKRRSSIEPMIGHLKNDGKLDKNFLKGSSGDQNHVLLCGIAHNLKMILRKLKTFFLYLRYFRQNNLIKILTRNLYDKDMAKV